MLTVIVCADLAIQEPIVNIKVRVISLSIILGSLPSRTLYYMLIFLVLGGIIGGIFYYIIKLRGEIKRLPRIPEDPND